MADRRRDVEGLRAVAVVAVVLYHMGLGAAGGGFVGVDVFFVVSGFLITGLLWRELTTTGHVRLGEFYARRARRLLPLSLFVILVTLLAAGRYLPPLRWPAMNRDATASALYVLNYRLAAGATGYLHATAAPSPLQHYWSLGVEEQFYLVWPALVMGLLWVGRRRGVAGLVAVLGAVAVLSYGASAWLTARAQPWAFFSLPTRAWEFVVGAAVALGVDVWRRLPRRTAAALGWLGLIAVVWSVVALGSTAAFPGTVAAVPVLGTAAILVAGTGEGRRGPSHLLGAGPLQPVGRISYAWYLWHWPVLVLGAAAVGHPLGLPAAALLAAASAVLAAVSERVIETPIRYAGRLVTQPRLTLTLAAVVSCTTAVLALTGPRPATVAANAAAAAPPPTLAAGALAAAAPRTTVVDQPGTSAPADPTGAAPPSAASDALRAATALTTSAVRTSISLAAVPSNLTPNLLHAHGDRARPFNDGCFDGFRDTAVHRCAYADTHSASHIVLFGDSHATAWFPAFEPIAQARGWQLENFSKATCPPLQAPVWAPNFGRTYRECDTWRAAVLQRIAAERPALVVLDMNRAYGPAYRLQQYGPAWLSGLGAMVQSLRASGAHVMVIGPVPRMPNDVPECLSAHLAAVATCEPATAAAMDANGIAAERSAVEAAGGYYLDTQPMFCTDAMCPAIIGNLLVFSDQNHLTATFAAWLSPTIAGAVDDALAHP